MAPRRLVSMLAVGLFVAAGPAALAQDKPFLFSSESKDSVPVAKMVGTTDPVIRPNSVLSTNLFVKNGAGDPHKMWVQALDAAGKVLAEARLEVEPGTYGRVKFAKPMPPMPAPGAAPAPAPMPMPMPAPMGPPGVELMSKSTPAAQGRAFEFILRLYDIDAIMKAIDEEKLDAAKADRKKKNTAEWKYTDQPVVLTISQPADYVTVKNAKYTNQPGTRLLEVTVEAKKALDPPCLVELQFPPQANLKADALREGIYRRTLTDAGKEVKLVATDLPDRDRPMDIGTFYLTIDGVTRAFVYNQNWSATVDKVDVTRQSKPAVRLYEEGKKEQPAEFISLPKDKFPVRIEVDNAGANSDLELRLARGNETIQVSRQGGARHEQVWLEPTAPEGALLITSRVSDWVIPVDTRDLRGRYTLTAALMPVAEAEVKEKPVLSEPLPFVLDDTPPETVSIGTLPDKTYRGRALRVPITAVDRESSIAKVVVFVGKPGPDGKLPDGAALIEATELTPGGGAWVAQVPIAADQKGAKIDLSAAATNRVGLTATTTQPVQLLDPPLGGTIKGVVKLGQFGKAQEGVPVLLKDGDGKDKATAKTGKKGEFTFEDVPPGAYKVSAARADAGVGTKGEETVRVLAGKTTEVTVTLSRKPMP